MAFVRELVRPLFICGLRKEFTKRCTVHSFYFPTVKDSTFYFISGGDHRTLSTNANENSTSSSPGSDHFRKSRNTTDEGRTSFAAFAIAFATISGGLGWILKKQKSSSSPDEQQPFAFRSRFRKVFAGEKIKAGQIKKDLPTYTEAEVAAHNSKMSKIWVTFGNGVYDITDYVDMHPGGKKILMASGKPLEPFWAIYSVHKNSEITEMLEVMRIGNLKEVAGSKANVDENDPYQNDPQRSPVLIPSSEKPFNAEPPQEILVDHFLTPNHLFFVRNHLPVPCVTLKNYSLELDLPKNNVLLTYDDLKKKFKKSCVVAVTQCAGNRRSEMVKVKPVKGLNWGIAAISNAKWTGVSLNDLLKCYNIDLETVKGKYIVFEGMDTQEDGSPYGASIPLELARMLKNEIIIAYEMNGEAIPRDHGFPVRVIIPGVVGARQVKWLKKIYFSQEESKSHWQRNDYKGFNSSIDWHNVNFDKSISITQLPVISAMCDPVDGSEIEAGSTEVTVKGYAWSGGGRGIIRVDISADGGKTWQEATLKPNGQTPYKSYAWTLWESTIPITEGVKQMTLVCKAVDVSYNVQPESVEGIWNLRGCLSNAWHRVNIKIP